MVLFIGIGLLVLFAKIVKKKRIPADRVRKIFPSEERRILRIQRILSFQRILRILNFPNF